MRLLAAVKQVEFIISTVGRAQIANQVNILEAASEAGTMKRFLPSEFGGDIDKLELDVPVTKPVYEMKLAVRRAVEQSGIPYTFVVSGAFASYHLTPILQDKLDNRTPRDGKLLIFGDGKRKAVFIDEDDIGTFTLKCIDDPRAANKSSYIRPNGNMATQNEVSALWEEKIGQTFEREVLDKEGVFKSIGELPFPANFSRTIKYHIFVNGDYSGELDPSKDVEATALYPDVKYITIDEYLNHLL